MFTVLRKMSTFIALACLSVSAWATPGFVFPDPEATLESNSVFFQWDAGGTDVTEWWLYVGTAEDDRTYFDSLSLGNDTSVTATGIPTDGTDVYATLYYREAGVVGWNSVGSSWLTEELEVTEPTIIEPVAGSIVDPLGILIDWMPNNTPANAWWIQIGSAPTWANYYSSGLIDDPLEVEPGLLSHFGGFEYEVYPVTAYITLWYRVGGVWSYTSISTHAASAPGDFGEPTDFYVLTQINGLADSINQNELPGQNAELTLLDPVLAIPPNIDTWWIYVGEAVGGNEYFDSGAIDPAGEPNINVTLNPTQPLPENGDTVFVTVWFKIDTGWYRQTYELASVPKPVM